jgi:hypothetical protein
MVGATVKYGLHVMCETDVCHAIFAAVQGCQFLPFVGVVQSDFAFIVTRSQEIVATVKIYRIYLTVGVLHAEECSLE